MEELQSPIPVNEALKDGCDKLIVVLTRHRKFIKPAIGYFSLVMRISAMAELLKTPYSI